MYSSYHHITLCFYFSNGLRQLAYPGQLVEVEHTLEEVQSGTYMSKLVAKVDPGRTLSAETFLIMRSEEHVFSYGYSKTLRLDTWNTPLR